MARWFFVFLIFLSIPAMSSDSPLKSGDVFKDCESCPELVVIPAGKFLMGDTEFSYQTMFIVNGHRDPPFRNGPVHQVEIKKPFAMGRFEITLEEWDACVKEGPCEVRRSAPTSLAEQWRKGLGSGRYPQQFVNFEDVQTYMVWMTKKTGFIYRLPSEAEWEYAARGGTDTHFWWGNEYISNKTVVTYMNPEGGDIAEVGSKEANPFGLFDMLGNLNEWTLDCVHDDYKAAPTDGAAWLEGNCKQRMVRGASYEDMYLNWIVVTARNHGPKNVRDMGLGFRILRELG
jgi:formylglycine-generating enzyme required for sulfatase activity